MSARTRSFQPPGNPFWCNAFLAMTIHHMILFVSLLLFLPVFLSCVFSKVTRILAVAATCLSQTWSVRSTVSFRFCFKEFPLEPNNEFIREITVQLVKFCEKKTANSIDLWLRCNSLSSVISVSLTTPQICRTALGQNARCEMSRDLSHVHRCWASCTPCQMDSDYLSRER